MEEGAGLGGYRLNTPDNMIRSVYSDHLHHNEGTHLDGGVVINAMWQHRWWLIGNPPIRWYDMLQGRIGRQFLQRPTTEIKGV